MNARHQINALGKVLLKSLLQVPSENQRANDNYSLRDDYKI